MPVECKKQANEMAAKKTGSSPAGLHSAVILVEPANRGKAFFRSC